ncbi:MAG: PHP domain-containing protein [Chitinivibrionales bacterium]|nr:PHP domain-containing protein [Chitinivibrionales bacterium]
MINVNTHIHSPYSFSSFESVDQAVDLAIADNVKVLGISDFNTVAGFEEFTRACAGKGVFPLYNIEFIALLEDDKAAGRRWNDPANPGAMYVCGKALDYPTSLSDDSRNRLRCLWKGSQDRIWKVINRLNDHLADTTVPVALDYNTIRAAYAKDTVRERHVARALVDALRERYCDDEELRGILRSIYGDRSEVADLHDQVALQNQVRAKLLKVGKPAYIEEEPSAFFSLDEIRTIILDGGGIPCYPVLADESKGLGEYESDPESLATELSKRRFHAVEFIPTRNGFEHLKHYVKVLRASGFCVTFGTEHNTPGLGPLVPKARGDAPFDQELLEIAYEGACILAAHQTLHAQGKDGWVNRRGHRLVAPESVAEFVHIGDEAIRNTVQTGKA